MRSVFRCLTALILTGSLQLAMAGSTAWQGQKLADYLDALNEQGLKIIYTSDLVRDDLRLVEEPDQERPQDGLPDVLRPFGLTAIAGPAGSLLVTRIHDRRRGQGPAGTKQSHEIPIPELVVTSSLHRLDYSHPGTHTYLDQELATRIPTTAEEAVRITNRLPGTASGGVSSRNHIRGGAVNEVLFLFDGLRLYEPYHLKDFQSIATIVNSNAIAGMDFFTGAYPARYGDRMSGVMNIEMRKPDKAVQTELALSFFNTSALSLGTFGGAQQGDWLVSGRRANLDLIIDVVRPEFGNLDYQDYIAHLGWDFGPRSRISANFLASHDKLTLADTARAERARASYANQVVWVKWLATWTTSLQSESIIAASDITNRRVGSLNLPGIVAGSLEDFREFHALEIRQDWSWVPSKSWMLRFGLDIKDLAAEYRFTSLKTVQAPFDSVLDNVPVTARDFTLAPAGAQHAAYTEFRWQPLQKLTVDLGLRWDQQTYTTAEEDRQYSPRAGILYQMNGKTALRFGWGQFYQAQEINELQLSDGLPDFFPAQRAEHSVLNLKHSFAAGVDLDLTLYRKSFRTVNPRFENSFNSLTLVPELQFDRVRVDATGAEAFGAELTLTRGSAEEDLLWWVGYAWSEVDDATEKGDIQRSWDQTQTLKAGLSWRWGKWDFSAAGELHTGWPKTELLSQFVSNPDGTQSLVLGTTSRDALRYSVFHTLDARVSRVFDVRRGDLTAFLEISNLYNRTNPCCTEYSLNPDGSLASRETQWLPLVPSLGVVWRF
ncbi:MAG: TonB-dependent receptor plug domain-containing protein [Woeseia sp.]